MTKFFSFMVLMLSFSAFAGSGIESLKIVLDQNEVETLEQDLRAKGFTLSNIQDVYATRGSFPRCLCRSLDLTFSRVRSGKAEVKKFNVSTQGFGTSLDVTINPVK